MASFKKLKVPEFPQIQERDTTEAKFWRNFSTTNEDKHFSAPSCINFDPSGSGNYIVTASTRVCLYEPLTDKIQRSFTRFQDDAYSGKFRTDGKLFVAGDKLGNVKVVDIHSKSVIRQRQEHTAAVHSACWASDSLHFISSSDDKTIKYWDLGTGELLWENASTHTDYIRSVDPSPLDPHVFISGSYDHSVNMWDTRQKQSVLRFDHDQSVGQCMFTPQGTMIFSANGNEIKIWDILSGNKVIHTFQNHQKHITNLCIDGTKTRLLSSGLDGYVKIYDFRALTYSYGLKFKAPLLSVAVSYDNKKLIAGHADGILEIRNKKKNTTFNPIGVPPPILSSESSDQLDLYFDPMGVMKKHRERDISIKKLYDHALNSNADIITDTSIESERRVRLKSYEKYLKKFQYGLALDSALQSRNPLIVIMIIDELCRRNGLVIALSSRDDHTLEPLLSFLARYINYPKYSKLLIHVTNYIIDIYESVLGCSEAIDELFLKLKLQIKSEISFQRELLNCLGVLDGIVNASLCNS